MRNRYKDIYLASKAHRKIGLVKGPPHENQWRIHSTCNIPELNWDDHKILFDSLTAFRKWLFIKLL